VVIVGRMRVAGIVAVVLLAVVEVFQIALAFGAPLGKASWGGKHDGVLPTRLRIASGVAAVIVYPLIILLVLAASGLIDSSLTEGTRRVGMWVLTALFVLGALSNFVSRSQIERTWGPVSLGVAVCCGLIARWI
jgi:hypothetical protein